MNRAHLVAVGQALLVAFLWATSWVLVKIGLRDIPALTFAGLRYALAFVCLLPFAWRAGVGAALRGLDRAGRLRLVALGLLFYSVTQGAQFVGLFYLPAVTVNLLLSFSSVAVALLGIALLGERPTPAQWGGVALYLLGVLIYFYPIDLPAGQALGLAVVVLGVLANSLSAVLGRSINRAGTLPPLAVTTASMGAGAAALLGVGAGVQGLPALSPASWLIVAWLAVVNTAFAFTLWNHTLRTLSAMESSLINSTLLIQIPILAWVFLGEALTVQKVVAILVAAAGIAAVQVLGGR